jgi:transposase
MGEVTTVGLDIAKSVFQVHGIDAAGAVVIRRQVRRGQVLRFFASLPPCLIGIEACATAHHWSRELQHLGHQVRLMPPAYVKPYVKRQKNDMADAGAICEAVTRPTMRFVETKSCEQQSVLMLHRVRLMLVKQRTMLTNAIRAHLAEFGLTAKIGREGVDELLLLVSNGDERIPELARVCVLALAEQLMLVKRQILEMDRRITACCRASEVSRRLAEIPGVGPLLASALVAHVPNPRAFSSGRNLAAWIGLVPKQNTARRGDQAGQSLFALDADGGSSGGDPLRPAPWEPAALDRATARPPDHQGGGGSAGQQDGPHGLGDHGEGRALSRACHRAGGIAPPAHPAVTALERATGR